MNSRRDPSPAFVNDTGSTNPVIAVTSPTWTREKSGPRALVPEANAPGPVSGAWRGVERKRARGRDRRQGHSKTVGPPIHRPGPHRGRCRPFEQRGAVAWASEHRPRPSARGHPIMDLQDRWPPPVARHRRRALPNRRDRRAKALAQPDTRTPPERFQTAHVLNRTRHERVTRFSKPAVRRPRRSRPRCPAT